MTVGSVAGSRTWNRPPVYRPPVYLEPSAGDQSRSVIGVMDNILVGVMDNILVLGKHQDRGPPINQFTVVRLCEPITSERERILVTLEPKT